MIIDRAPKNQQEMYCRFLKGSASLGRIFTGTTTPLIPASLAEIIFTKAFNGNGVGTQDTSLDIILLRAGIGIKTFRGVASQKIAEFNDRQHYPLTDGDPHTIVQEISRYRNQRLKESIKRYDVDDDKLFYHFTYRTSQSIQVHETEMNFINESTIDNINSKSTSVSFDDGKHLYRYNYDKSTLYMKFDLSNPILEIEHEFLNPSVDNRENIKYLLDTILEENLRSIALPLYGRNYTVFPRSGLNRWRARGRKRHQDELYIPIPRSIHLTNPGFFPERDVLFNLKTDNGEVMKAKVCQDGSKALMSNPNKSLGKWVLRRVLNLLPGEVATMKTLIKRHIDSVIITKVSDGNYSIRANKGIQPGQQILF